MKKPEDSLPSASSGDDLTDNASSPESLKATAAASMSSTTTVPLISGPLASSSSITMSDVDVWLSKAKTAQKLEEIEIFRICQIAKDIFVEEANIVDVSSPVTVCGDIHGQFYDLLELFRIADWPPKTNFIFMGDFVDRGFHSVETIILLLLLKIRHPKQIVLLRGNHECRQISQVYGFYDECMKKYGGIKVWKYCCDLFDYFPIAALVDGRVFCIHGGLSPMLRTLDQIRRLERCVEIPHDGPLCDLMWSDPEDLENETWSFGPRGAGYLFGRRVVAEFNQINDLLMIARAHQLVQEGFKFMFPEKSLVTVWSAPNYCYRCGNVASVMRVNPDLTFSNSNFSVFSATANQFGNSGSGFGREKSMSSDHFL